MRLRTALRITHDTGRSSRLAMTSSWARSSLGSRTLVIVVGFAGGFGVERMTASVAVYDVARQAMMGRMATMDYLGEPHNTPVHLTERFSRFVNHLGEAGGSVERRLGLLADDLALPLDALRRMIDRATELGIIRTQTNGTYIGMGRRPNSYHLRIEWADWPKLRSTLAAAYQDKLDEKVRRSEAARARRRADKTIARRAAAKAPVRVWPPPPPPAAERILSQPTPTVEVGADEVDAWFYAGDF